MKELIALLNKMKDQGIVEDYALGGATALVYYFEPINTQDVDVFVFLKAQNQTLLSLEGIFDFFRANGGTASGEYIIFHDIPVQFLVPYNVLVEKAVREATIVQFADLPVRILSLEFLMAIMVQTGRPKDKSRLHEINDVGLAYDKDVFLTLLKEFELTECWKRIKGEK